MNLFLHQSFASSSAVKLRLSSARDRELLSTKILIQYAPILRHSSELHASLIRNALHVSRNRMANCIRVLCNYNITRGFQIGKDTALPVTYIRSSETPLRDIGGKPPRERHILAFFTGGTHGYLRPILLKHWENKEPDMKIFGPMPRDVEGKMAYRE
ncbi:hypothetical protein RJ641_026039 [Dillenia turbinata]|uniref:Uncharacterized protein n=1 Tax=Dillenia turbinata TaxID=194707 RepID=A0AAN8WFB3_9MAGN